LAKHDSIAAFHDTGRAMAHHFREPERRQAFLLPADMMDWLPEGDIVHLIVDAVAMMDLGGFEADYKLGRAGQAPFAPQVLLALLIYAYSRGVRSSRVIERLCGRDAGYRFIVGDAVPDHTVIARFRQRHVARMREVFLAVLRLCHEAGLVRLGLVALDGTKVGANAALDANRTAGRIDEQVAKMLTEAEATDAQEDSRFGAQHGDELPAALARRSDRLARLQQCQDKLQRQAAEAASRQQEKIDARAAAEQASGQRKRGRKLKPADPTVDPDTVANVTDPESGIMKTRHGWLQGYNAQIVVTTGQIILAADVTTEANDVHQLTPMLGQAQANVALMVGEAELGAAVADAGYWSDANAATETDRCRRTAAIASLKVGSRLAYQAVARGVTIPIGVWTSRSAQTVIKENNPSSAGVVRRMARSDHCRCVSTPRWVRVSWNVVSIRQRETNQLRICSGLARSVLRKHCGSRSPVGSRTSTQRIDAGGRPELYQTAVSDTISSMRDLPPYQSVTVIGTHTVLGSASTALNAGRRRPFTRGRPICPTRRGGAGANRLASIRSLVTRQT